MTNTYTYIYIYIYIYTYIVSYAIGVWCFLERATWIAIQALYHLLKQRWTPKKGSGLRCMSCNSCIHCQPVLSHAYVCRRSFCNTMRPCFAAASILLRSGKTSSAGSLYHGIFCNRRIGSVAVPPASWAKNSGGDGASASCSRFFFCTPDRGIGGKFDSLESYKADTGSARNRRSVRIYAGLHCR